MRNLLTLIAVPVLAAACGGSGTGGNNNVLLPAFVYEQPDTAICDTSTAVSNGLLCAIQPSRLDASTRDVFGSGSAADLIFGFGYHVVAFPSSGTTIKGVYVHFTGSYGRPYNQLSDAYGNPMFLNEALSAGFITIQLAYHNRFSINIDECNGDAVTLSIDNCSGDARMEKISGVDVSSVVDTPPADSIEFRMVTLVNYLQTQGFEFPFAVVTNDTVNWASLRVGGHSQGATHALYLAKYFFAARACLLAGGYDIADTFPVVPAEDLADWLLDDSVQLNIGGIRALVSVDDSFYDSFVRTYEYLGMLKDTHYVEVAGAPYADSNGASINGHSAVLNDPRYMNQRLEACFAD